LVISDKFEGANQAHPKHTHTFKIMSVKLPKQLVESLQQAFLSEARRVCRDAAKLLHQDPNDVLAILKKMPPIQFQVVDDSDAPTTCPVLLQKGAIVERCRFPCILGTGVCMNHQQESEPPSIESCDTKLTRMKHTETDMGPLWCDEETRNVYSREGVCVGALTDENVLELFTYE
jgi:hypothetical protein